MNEVEKRRSDVLEERVDGSLVEAAGVNGEKSVVEVDGDQFDVLALQAEDDVAGFGAFLGHELRTTDACRETSADGVGTNATRWMSDLGHRRQRTVFRRRRRRWRKFARG